HPERARWARRHARRMRASAAAAYLGALALAGSRGLAAAAVALLPLAVVLVYSFPFVPAPLARRLGFRRLKEVLVVKNVVVALTLAATPVLLAAAARRGGPVPWTPLGAAGAFLFARWWINTVFFDLRDEAGDRENGVRTIPVVLGRAPTLRLLHATNALLGAGAVVAPAAGLAPPAFALLALGSVYAWAYLRRFARGGDPHFLCDVVADGEILVLAAVVLAARLLGG
ncbi:MAG TPA: UbiA family prenyltransferase, partial [Longimicrobium sp.]|nr:UbiA family prenyltransferase [Longimicrobium sp.]